MVEEKDSLTTEDMVANMVLEMNALISLLIEKGVITEAEYDAKLNAIEEEMLKEE